MRKIKTLDGNTGVYWVHADTVHVLIDLGAKSFRTGSTGSIRPFINLKCRVGETLYIAQPAGKVLLLSPVHSIERLAS